MVFNFNNILSGVISATHETVNRSVFHKNVSFEQYLGKLGKVERVGKTVVIKYDDGSTWGFHPDAVRKVQYLYF